jgi:hypothetical protein
MIAAHREKDCSLTEVVCKVIGCNARVIRKDYEKHEEEAAKQHVHLLSVAVQKLSATVEKLERLIDVPLQVKL